MKFGCNYKIQDNIINYQYNDIFIIKSGCGGIGRHAILNVWWTLVRGGSRPSVRAMTVS